MRPDDRDCSRHESRRRALRVARSSSRLRPSARTFDPREADSENQFSSVRVLARSVGVSNISATSRATRPDDVMRPGVWNRDVDGSQFADGEFELIRADGSAVAGVQRIESDVFISKAPSFRIASASRRSPPPWQQDLTLSGGARVASAREGRLDTPLPETVLVQANLLSLFLLSLCVSVLGMATDDTTPLTQRRFRHGSEALSRLFFPAN